MPTPALVPFASKAPVDSKVDSNTGGSTATAADTLCHTQRIKNL